MADIDEQNVEDEEYYAKLDTDRSSKLPDDDVSLNRLFSAILDLNDRLERQETEINRLRGDDKQLEDSYSMSPSSTSMSRRSSSNSNVKANIHKVPRAAPMSRRNMSFNNQQTKEIERENQRLLSEIQKKKKPKTKKKRTQDAKVTAPPPKPVHVTTSLVNRRRDAQRIQFENLLLLKRLQKAKPTEFIKHSTSTVRSRPQTPNKPSDKLRKRAKSADGRPASSSAAGKASLSRSKTSKNATDKRPVWEAGW